MSATLLISAMPPVRAQPTTTTPAMLMELSHDPVHVFYEDKVSIS